MNTLQEHITFKANIRSIRQYRKKVDGKLQFQTFFKLNGFPNPNRKRIRYTWENPRIQSWITNLQNEHTFTAKEHPDEVEILQICEIENDVVKNLS